MVRAGDARQCRDFTRVVHSKLEYSHFGVVRNSENRERETDVVVKIPIRFAGTEASTQQCGTDILRGGFASTTREAENGLSPSFSRPTRQTLQCRERIRQHKGGNFVVSRFLDYERRRPISDGLLDERMAVLRLTAHRKEKRAGRHPA
jgi:hypothetical protein